MHPTCAPFLSAVAWSLSKQQLLARLILSAKEDATDFAPLLDLTNCLAREEFGKALGKDNQDLDELVRALSLRILASLPNFEPRGPKRAYAWVRVLIRNIHRDYRRERAKRHHVDLDLDTLPSTDNDITTTMNARLMAPVCQCSDTR